MRDDKAYIVGQLHSGHNKGGSTSNHVTYCTPGWWLLAEIKKKYKNAVFYPETWPVRLFLPCFCTWLTNFEACAW